jgi:hypothetical protein
MNARAEVKARGPSTSLEMTEGKGDAQILRLVIARSIVFAHSFVIRHSCFVILVTFLLALVDAFLQ